MLRGNWSSSRTTASAPSGVNSQSLRSPRAAASYVKAKRSRQAASSASSLANQRSGAASRPKETTSSGVARVGFSTGSIGVILIPLGSTRPADDKQERRGPGAEGHAAVSSIAPARAFKGNDIGFASPTPRLALERRRDRRFSGWRHLASIAIIATSGGGKANVARPNPRAQRNPRLGAQRPLQSKD